MHLVNNNNNNNIPSDLPTNIANTVNISNNTNYHLNVDICNSELSVTRAQLRNMCVIGQVSNCYIITTCITAPTVLYCMDQHAVDERVHLEEYSMRIHTAQRNYCQYRNSNESITPTLPLVGVYELLTLNKAELLVLESNEEAIRDWGFEWQIKSDSTSVLTQSPVILEEVITVSDFMEYLHYLQNDWRCSRVDIGTMLDAMKVNKSTTIYPVPPAVTRILASRACRSSIMFGTHLSNSECLQLISKLSNTEYPFQCAHGRPTVLPLMQIRHK